MSAGKVVVKQAFGLSATVKNALTFTEDHHLAYLCGHQVAVINTESKEQNFISGTSTYQHQSLGVTAMVNCFSKKIIAVAEKVEPSAIITFYDSHTLRKKKLLTHAELGSNEIVCMAFSEDGRYLICQGGSPEWNLVLWSIEKNVKVLCSLRMALNDDTPIIQVSICPWDSSVILVLGKSILKLFRFVDGQLRPLALTVRREQANFISHCWIPEENLVIGTETGDLVFIENFEFRGYISAAGAGSASNANHPSNALGMSAGGATAAAAAASSSSSNTAANTTNTALANTSDASGASNNAGAGGDGDGGAEAVHPVLCLTPTARGFLMGSSNGQMKLFERQEDIKEKYQLEDSFRLFGDSIGNVIEFAMGPDEMLVCGTDSHQLLQIQLSNVGMIKEAVGGMENILTSFHSCNDKGDSTITGIDVALWKQLLVTTGRDGTLRVWNPSEKKMELMKKFDEEPVSLSMHPSGMYVAVAFSDKILILSLLLEGIHKSREMVARNCSHIKFSRGGQFVAAANGTNLQIYNTFTGQPMGTLRGHNNKIKSIVWLQNDARIMTIGSEGVVYFWDLFPVNRRPEHFSSTVPIAAGTGPMDGSRTYIGTQDKLIKEISFSHGDFGAVANALATAASVTGTGSTEMAAIKASKQVDLGFYASTMIFDETRRLLIMGTYADEFPGAIVTAMVSPTLNEACEVNHIHSGTITAMCQSIDGKYLYTADTNGCICISEFEKSTALAGSAKTREGGNIVSFEFIDEVMIHRKDLDRRKNMIEELTGKVDELNQNNEHQLRLKDLDHKDKLKQITAKFRAQLDAEKLKYDELDQEKQVIEKDFAKKVKLLEHTQVDELRAIEFKYKTKQNGEENRLKILKEEIDDAHRRWNEENAALVESHQKYLQELTVEYEEKLLAEQHTQKNILGEKSELKINFESGQGETENDGDREVAEMKIRYDAKLKAEEETSLQLMHQHAVMAKAHEALTKDSNQQKIEIKRLKDKETRLYETIHSLEKDIQSHKKEIREREETITDKEKRIFDLKKKNQELEKFRFVLDYKIKELKLQIAPRENEINTMRTQIGEMDLELDQYNKSNLALNLMIEELKLKLEGVKRELLNQTDRCQISTRFMDKLQRDLVELWSLKSDQTAFKACMIKLYRIYVQEDVSPSLLAGDGSGGGRKGDSEDPQQVYNRDREQMERSLDSLRRALKTEALAHKRDLGKMMRESVMLTKELNTLRKNARSLQLQQKAILEAGDLQPSSDLTELLELLGLQQKKPPAGLAGPGASRDVDVAAAAGAAGRGMPPLPPGGDRTSATGAARAKGHRGGNMLSRTAALKTTDADGKVSTKVPLRRSNSAGANGAAPGSGASAIGLSKHDQWEAWREIQIQFDQMKLLEENLTAVCNSLSIDAIPVLVGIDATIA